MSVVQSKSVILEGKNLIKPLRGWSWLTAAVGTAEAVHFHGGVHRTLILCDRYVQLLSLEV
jgi:hypothetical protein